MLAQGGSKRGNKVLRMFKHRDDIPPSPSNLVTYEKKTKDNPNRTICPTSFSRPMCFFDSLMILVIRSNRSDFSSLASLNPASFSE